MSYLPVSTRPNTRDDASIRSNLLQLAESLDPSDQHTQTCHYTSIRETLTRILADNERLQTLRSLYYSNPSEPISTQCRGRYLEEAHLRFVARKFELREMSFQITEYAILGCSHSQGGTVVDNPIFQTNLGQLDAARKEYFRSIDSTLSTFRQRIAEHWRKDRWPKAATVVSDHNSSCPALRVNSVLASYVTYCHDSKKQYTEFKREQGPDVMNAATENKEILGQWIATFGARQSCALTLTRLSAEALADTTTRCQGLYCLSSIHACASFVIGSEKALGSDEYEQKLKRRLIKEFEQSVKTYRTEWEEAVRERKEMPQRYSRYVVLPLDGPPTITSEDLPWEELNQEQRQSGADQVALTQFRSSTPHFQGDIASQVRTAPWEDTTIL